MKKILKKIIMSTLALMLTIASVNTSSIEVDAARKTKTYSGHVYVTTKMPACASGEITLSNDGNSAKSGWISMNDSRTMTLRGRAKSGEYAVISVKAETTDGTFYTTFRVKAHHLGKKKKFKIKYKTKGIGVLAKITGISVSAPLF